MNDKERLQLAKELLSIMKSRHKFSEMMSIESVDIETMEWLINRAEKVEQLQQKIARLTKERDQYFDDKVLWSAALKIKDQQLQQAQAKAERYEKALREIANEQEVGEGDFNADDVANKLIAIAKEALENKFL